MGSGAPEWFVEALLDDEVTVVGDFAYARTRSEGTQTILATDETTSEANRELFTFAKEDGRWKIARYLFNKMS